VRERNRLSSMVDRKNDVVLVISAMILLLMLFHNVPLSDAWMASSPPIVMRHHRNSISSHHRHCKPRLYGIASLLSCLKIDSSLRASTAAPTPIMVADSHSSNDDSTMAVEQLPIEPILRGLYTPPPTQVADNSTHEDGWITKVTNGTMSTNTGNGSPHILYYEVHRRSYYRNMSSSSSTTTPSTTSTTTTTTTTTTAKKKQQGLTALFLHGGPGAACNANHVRFFNPALYETVVLLDQRGCGRSVPLGEVSYNTLELLVEDIEQLRHVIFSTSSSSYYNNDEHESITSTTTTSTTRPWDTIVGGSWGCTLALAYAHTFPTNVRSLVLRGVCMFRPKEIDWLFGDPPPLYNNKNNNNNGMRSTTANLRLLLEDGGGERGRRRDTTSSITTAATTNNINGITTGTTTTTTVRTAAEVFTTGWDEFRKGSNILRPRSPFSKQRMTNANQPTTTTSRRDTLNRYYNLILGSTDPNVRNDAVKSWLRWEMGIYSSGFCNIRGPTTTTSSSRAAHQDEVKKNYNNNNNTVLVYYPSTSSWSYEDTRVWTNDSFVSIGTYNNSEMREQPEEMANSLRRFSTSSSSTVSSTTSSLGLASLDDDGILRPLPFHPMDATSSTSGKNYSTTPTPTTYIPAQSMLTVFYSANDDYCIGRYKSFLSMERQQQQQQPQSSDDTAANERSKSSWFSSALPPEMPVLTTLSNKQFSKNPVSSSTKSSTTTTSSFPLPPTIAIQGGNDAICPPDTALDLHEVWKEMELRIVLQSGHSMYDPLIAGEIVKALDRFGHSLIET
jgi:pimeloyl-ACP methyl ester carboxylesterase